MIKSDSSTVIENKFAYLLLKVADPNVGERCRQMIAESSWHMVPQLLKLYPSASPVGKRAILDALLAFDGKARVALVQSLRAVPDSLVRAPLINEIRSSLTLTRVIQRIQNVEADLNLESIAIAEYLWKFLKMIVPVLYDASGAGDPELSARADKALMGLGLPRGVQPAVGDRH